MANLITEAYTAPGSVHKDYLKIRHRMNPEKSWVELRCITWDCQCSNDMLFNGTDNAAAEAEYVCLYNYFYPFRDTELKNGEYVESDRFKSFKEKYVTKPGAIVLADDIFYDSTKKRYSNEELKKFIGYGYLYKKELNLDMVYLLYTWKDFFGKQNPDEKRLIILS